jgi:glycosyltransferase involved in cell wall biosynthesis
VTILHLMSCRGWSSDAYWAARMSVELERAGHEVMLVCKGGSESRVIQRAREIGAGRIETLGFAGGLRPLADLRDLGTLRRWLRGAQAVHVHRGKEHWLAALANRAASRPIPLVRTRHIVQPVRPHALNRWLYGRATSAVVTVTEAIRRQYVAAELLPPERVLALPGGVDVERFRPSLDGEGFRRTLPGAAGVPLIGMVSGLRTMKGHHVAVEAAARLARAGRRFHMVFIGRGAREGEIRQAIVSAGLADRITVAGFAPDLPGAMAAFDIALYPPLESDGMSRVLFEYLAAGRAVVASRVGAAAEVVEDGETAVLVPAGEAAPLADAIARLLDDAALRARLGTAAAALARARLSGARVAGALAGLYAALGADGAARP